MSTLLIVNPNTSATVSTLLQSHGQRAAGPDVQVQVVTAGFGAPYISCEASYAVASHAVLQAWAQAMALGDAQPDAVLIGCFGDPSLLALREASAAPVTGLAEASFAHAALHGRFAIVTGGERWKPILQRLAHSLGYSHALAGITTVAPTGAELAQNPDAARALLADACAHAARDFDARAVILGGAGLAGMAAQVQAQLSVPLIDSVVAGVRHSLWLAAQQPAQQTGRQDEIRPWLLD